MATSAAGKNVKGIWDPFQRQSTLYLLSRPDPPQPLLAVLREHHVHHQHRRSFRNVDDAKAPSGVCVDVACGSGQATRHLARLGAFESVIAFDRSAAMLAEFDADAGADAAPIHVLSGDAHDLEAALVVDDDAGAGSRREDVTAITAAQAAHWFDLPTFFRSCGRVLASTGGTLHILGYGTPSLLSRDPAEQATPSGAGDPAAEAMARHATLMRPWFDKKCDRESLDTAFGEISGPSWAAPVDDACITAVQAAASKAEGGNVRFNDGSDGGDGLDVRDNLIVERHPSGDSVHAILRRTFWGVSPEAIGDYLRTWSAYVAYKEAHSKETDEDPVDAVVSTLKQIDGPVGITFPFFLRSWGHGGE